MTRAPIHDASGVLVTITLATRMLAEARTLDHVRNVLDLAEAARRCPHRPSLCRIVAAMGGSAA